MARSSYIYVLIDASTGDYLGAFTVKHEMESARKSCVSSTYYLRFHDGQIEAPIEVE